MDIEKKDLSFIIIITVFEINQCSGSGNVSFHIPPKETTKLFIART